MYFSSLEGCCTETGFFKFLQAKERYTLKHPSLKVQYKLKNYLMSFDCDVPERRLIFEIQDRRLVVCQDKREDWILHKVVERPPCQFVELHQVVKVCDSPCVRNKSSISRHDCDVSTVSINYNAIGYQPSCHNFVSFSKERGGVAREGRAAVRRPRK